jgi:hypothetical protein
VPEPFLFWASLATLPVAIVCFVLAMRVTPQRLAVRLQIASQLIAGIALPLMGYEIAARSGAKSISDMQPNTGIGLLLITAGLLCLGELVAKAFDK